MKSGRGCLHFLHPGELPSAELHHNPVQLGALAECLDTRRSCVAFYLGHGFLPLLSGRGLEVLLRQVFDFQNVTVLGLVMRQVRATLLTICKWSRPNKRKRIVTISRLFLRMQYKDASGPRTGRSCSRHPQDVWKDGLSRHACRSDSPSPCCPGQAARR